MSNYDIFGKFYDAVMGDRAGAAGRLRGYIRNANPRAKSVLELGCGTGSVLKHLASNYEVSGVDLSNRMLTVAAKKVPRAKLFRQDMTRFRLNRRFDVICCVFDSINHVLRFSDWRTMFSQVSGI
jgi:predicted TPR repeat methyltransferase